MGIAILALLLTMVVFPSTGMEALFTAIGIFQKIIPILALVWLLMTLFSFFLPPKRMKDALNRSRGAWLLAIAGGVLSTGPIYAWYPMLKELRDNGVRKGFVATFLYNRAIKIPLLPVALSYFGYEFVIILLLVMVLASLAQGLLIEWLVPDVKPGIA